MYDVPNTEELSGSSSKSDVGASKVVDSGLGEHGVVLNLRLAQGWAVTRDQDELRCSNQAHASGG